MGEHIPGEAIIRVDGVSKSYGRIRALEDIAEQLVDLAAHALEVRKQVTLARHGASLAAA